MIPKDINSYYRLHSRIYDLTRWSFLFGRNRIPSLFPDINEPEHILDLGCGTGVHLHQLSSHYPKAHITGLDQSSDMLKIAKRHQPENVKLIQGEYTRSTFDEHSFDLILASYSLSMIPEFEKSLECIRYHLNPGGILLVVDFDSTPFHFFSKWMNKNHVYLEYPLFRRITEVFEVKSIQTMSAYFGLYTYSTLLASNPK